MIQHRFTLCFLTYQHDVLLLHRQKPPNQGLWNGVGGHIEKGETPHQNCLREVSEETGICLDNLDFYGLLTWEGFEIPAGGLYLFSAPAPTQTIIQCNEGLLAWHPQDWACTSPTVVSNLHIILPYIFKKSKPFVYHFIYDQQSIRDYRITSLLTETGVNEPWFG